MRRGLHVVGGLAAFLLALAINGTAHGQDKDGPPKAIELKGEAQVNSLAHKMEKGATYRIVVKAEGFHPTVRLAAKYGTVASAEGYGTNQATLIYTPMETLEYQVIVGTSLAGKLDKGPFKFALTIDKADFVSENKVQEPLKVSEQTQKLEKGKIYVVKVASKDFEADMRILKGDEVIAKQASPGRDFSKPAPPNDKVEVITSALFVAPETSDYRILVTINPYGRTSKDGMAYSMSVVESKPALAVDGKLTRDDPLYADRKTPHKVHEIKLEEGKTYQIDLASKGFEGFLCLENSAKKVLLINDSGGAGRNATIVFRPTKTDTFRIVATSFGLGAGTYTLTVVENPGARPSVPLPGDKGFNPKEKN